MVSAVGALTRVLATFTGLHRSSRDVRKSRRRCWWLKDFDDTRREENVMTRLRNEDRQKTNPTGAQTSCGRGRVNTRSDEDVGRNRCCARESTANWQDAGNITPTNGAWGSAQLGLSFHARWPVVKKNLGKMIGILTMAKQSPRPANSTIPHSQATISSGIDRWPQNQPRQSLPP